MLQVQKIRLAPSCQTCQAENMQKATTMLKMAGTVIFLRKTTKLSTLSNSTTLLTNSAQQSGPDVQPAGRCNNSRRVFVMVPTRRAPSVMIPTFCWIHRLTVLCSLIILSGCRPENPASGWRLAVAISAWFRHAMAGYLLRPQQAGEPDEVRGVYRVDQESNTRHARIRYDSQHSSQQRYVYVGQSVPDRRVLSEHLSRPARRTQIVPASGRLGIKPMPCLTAMQECDISVAIRPLVPETLLPFAYVHHRQSSAHHHWREGEHFWPACPPSPVPSD